MAWIRDPKVFARYRHIVLSPHLDDAALSVGGLIGALTARGEPVLVLTLCAGLPSPLATLAGLGAKLASHAASTPFEYVTLRRCEEARALAHLGADHYFATTLDAIDRVPELLTERADLFRPPRRDDPIRRAARAVFFLAVAHAPEARFLAPLGIGAHIDHLGVFDAALEIVPRARLAFYEDFPYVGRPGALDARRATLGGSLSRESVDVSRTLRLRIAAIAEYESQIPNLFGSREAMRQAVRASAGTPATERLWHIPGRPKPRHARPAFHR